MPKTYAEMLEQPFNTYTLPDGLVGMSLSRKVDELPQVMKAVDNRGLMIGRPETFRVISQRYPDLLGRDTESGPPTLRWRSVMPTQREGDEKQLLSLRWTNIPGNQRLAELLTPDERRYLLFTVAIISLTKKDPYPKFGYAIYSQNLLKLLEGQL